MVFLQVKTQNKLGALNGVGFGSEYRLTFSQKMSINKKRSKRYAEEKNKACGNDGSDSMFCWYGNDRNGSGRRGAG
jgi:hypothetical protein